MEQTNLVDSLSRGVLMHPVSRIISSVKSAKRISRFLLMGHFKLCDTFKGVSTSPQADGCTSRLLGGVFSNSRAIRWQKMSLGVRGWIFWGSICCSGSGTPFHRRPVCGRNWGCGLKTACAVEGFHTSTSTSAERQLWVTGEALVSICPSRWVYEHWSRVDLRVLSG